MLAGCGGGDGDATSVSTTTIVAAATTTLAPATTTTVAAPTTTIAEVAYVTDGASVVVANASGINGAAGRLSERLAVVGYDMEPATNSGETISNIEVTQIYHDPTNAGALAVAESLRVALGGGAITVAEVLIPAPTESGDLGEADVLVLMGNDIADKTLDEMQGTTASADATTPDATAPDDTSVG